MTETVEVSAQAVLLDSESSTLGQVIGQHQSKKLPLRGRNPYAVPVLAPGVRPSVGVNNLPIEQISTVSFMINGQRASSNEFLLAESAGDQHEPARRSGVQGRDEQLQPRVRPRGRGRLQRRHAWRLKRASLVGLQLPAE